MRPFLAIARFCLAAGLGYAFVWAFSDPTPGWADVPLEEPARFDLADLRLTEAFSAISLGDQAQAAPPPESLAVAVASESRAVPPFEGLGMTAAALALTREAEPLRLRAEQDEEGAWVIGYGRRLSEQPAGGVTPDHAMQMLREDLTRAEESVRGAVHIPLNANEYGALVEFARSIGPENFPDTLVPMLLNAGDREAAADAFMIWSKVRVEGALVDSDDLIAERERARELFLKPIPANAS
jgi:lysozyme